MTECLPSLLSSFPRAMSEASVESEEAVGDALEVVYLLDVRSRLGADPLALGRRGDERLECRAERLLRRSHDGNARVELPLRTRDGLVVQERHDRLAERHALDREQPVPARVQLVDDDVGLAVALERLVVVESLDEEEVCVEARTRLDHVLRSLATARGGRVQDDR